MANVSAKELFILGRVSLRPTHGHEIMRTLRESRADLWIELSEKHVYYVLRKLDREGLVTSTEERVGGLPPRNVYSVTDAGRAALAEMLSADDLTRAMPHSEFDVLLGMLSYTDALDDEAKSAVLRKRRAALQAALRDAADEQVGAAGVGGFPKIILERVIGRLGNELEWLTAIEERVAEGGWASMTPTFEAPDAEIAPPSSPTGAEDAAPSEGS
jgi:DNA-binding PadR family transcriptional regulator